MCVSLSLLEASTKHLVSVSHSSGITCMRKDVASSTPYSIGLYAIGRLCKEASTKHLASSGRGAWEEEEEIIQNRTRAKEGSVRYWTIRGHD